MLYLINQGDELAFEIMYEKYSPLVDKKIFDYGLKVDFEDNFQECMITLSRAIDTYRDSKTTFFVYFNTCLTHKIVSLYRSNKRKNRLEINEETSEFRVDIKPSFDLSESEKEDLFNGLSKEEKLITILRYIKDWNVKDIMEEYDLSESQVYYILRKAKNKIRKNYDKLYKNE